MTKDQDTISQAMSLLAKRRHSRETKEQRAEIGRMLVKARRAKAKKQGVTK